MIVSVLQENLLKTLNRAGRIISQRSQLPILQNVLLVASGGILEVVGNNMETTEKVKVGAKVEKEGGICVSAKTLLELVLTLPQETVHLSAKEGILKVKCAGYSATIPGSAASEFPPVPTLIRKKALGVSKDLLFTSLSKVLFAAATDEGRPLLTGVKIHTKDQQLLMAATDGYRLSVKSAKMSLGGLPKEAVVPARALSEVARVAQEEKEEKEVAVAAVGESQLGFWVGDTEIITRLISGDYPNYEKIIPAQHATRALINKDSLNQAVRAAAIFARDNANIIKIIVDKQKIVVAANAPQVGEGSVEIEAKVDGEGGEIAFNSRFLLDFLANLSEEEFLFEMTGSLNPGVFRPVKDDSYLHLIMPVRVQS